MRSDVSDALKGLRGVFEVGLRAHFDPRFDLRRRSFGRELISFGSSPQTQRASLERARSTCRHTAAGHLVVLRNSVSSATGCRASSQLPSCSAHATLSAHSTRRSSAGHLGPVRHRLRGTF